MGDYSDNKKELEEIVRRLAANKTRSQAMKKDAQARETNHKIEAQEFKSKKDASISSNNFHLPGMA